MADFDEPHPHPHPDLQRFLSDRAGELDRGATTISADEAAHRVVTHSLEPARRWIHTPAAVAEKARRRPAMAAAVIAALLVGSLGGFAVGRGSAPKKATVAARGAAQDSSTPSTIVTNFATAGGSASVGGFGYPGGGPQLTKLFIRMSADGVALRGYLQTMQGQVPQPMCDASTWCPPAECNPSTYFMGEFSNAEAVSQNGSPEFPLDKAPASSRGQTQLGSMENAPASVYIVQTNSDVVSVRGTWPDGYVDEMQPVNGWAAVAHIGSTAASKLEAVLTDGSTFALPYIEGEYSYPASCQPPPPPPPELPPAGSEQPADADSARAAVTAAYQYVFTNGNDPSQNGNYVEDADNLKQLGDQAKANFQQASDTITVEVGEIRFLSATEAALFFELKYQGGALFGQQIGYAKFIDGQWKISRDTMCMVFSWAGAQCDPPPDPARSSTSGSGGGGVVTSKEAPTATTTPN